MRRPRSWLTDLTTAEMAPPSLWRARGSNHQSFQRPALRLPPRRAENLAPRRSISSRMPSLLLVSRESPRRSRRAANPRNAQSPCQHARCSRSTRLLSSTAAPSKAAANYGFLKNLLHLDRLRMTNPMSPLTTKYPWHRRPVAKIDNHSAVRANNYSTSSNNHNNNSSSSSSSSTNLLMTLRLS